jgi:hypothetical protein
MASLLIRIGVGVALLSIFPLGCSYVFTRQTHEVSVDDLGAFHETTQVLVSDGIADWDDRLDIDLAAPVAVDAVELVARRKDLRGRVVRVSGLPEAVMIRKQFQYKNGTTVELGTDTRIYAPLSGSNGGVWVLSPAMDVRELEDPRVSEFAATGTYEGVVEDLSSVVPLEELRNATTQPRKKNRAGRGRGISAPAEHRLQRRAVLGCAQYREKPRLFRTPGRRVEHRDA